MNNKTIKKFEITIKLRGDNVYDIYADGTWIASCGSYISAASEVKTLMEKTFLEESAYQHSLILI